MSELINNRNRATIRWKLLTGVSALALTGYVSSVELAKAEDANHPMLWIELDGQYSQLENSGPSFAPPFMSPSPFDGISHLGLERGPAIAWDKGGKITLQPEGSDWFFVLGARYGKTSRSAARNSRPTTAGLTKYSGKHYDAYQNLSTRSSESHVILDFQVGKDVGLGSFGGDGTSAIGAGIRIAQFHARSHANIKSQPTNLPTSASVNRFDASFDAAGRFTGLGPSLSWDASATLLGNPSGGSITFDWGVNGALLFGRQKTTTGHATSESHFHYYHRSLVYQTSNASVRSRTVTVPNLGGFAGVSWRYPNAKVSFGYRADFFFGAMDAGLDTRRTTDVGFHGPFATIAIGLGG